MNSEWYSPPRIERQHQFVGYEHEPIPYDKHARRNYMLERKRKRARELYAHRKRLAERQAQLKGIKPRIGRQKPIPTWDEIMKDPLILYSDNDRKFIAAQSK